MKKKVSLCDEFEIEALSFRSADGTYKYKGLPIHIVKKGESVITSDVPNSVYQDNRFVVEDVVKETKKKE